jgi:hypothetical protein
MENCMIEEPCRGCGGAGRCFCPVEIEEYDPWAEFDLDWISLILSDPISLAEWMIG